MLKHRILILENALAMTAISRALVAEVAEAMKAVSGNADNLVLVCGENVRVEQGDTITISSHLVGKPITIEYAFKRSNPAPAPVFTGPRRSKGERKRNKANRWS